MPIIMQCMPMQACHDEECGYAGGGKVRNWLQERLPWSGLMLPYSGTVGGYFTTLWWWFTRGVWRMDAD